MQPADQQGEPSSELAVLRQQAVEKFGLSCLWSMKPFPSPHGMRLGSDQLRKYGGMDTLRLAGKNEAVLGQAILRTWGRPIFRQGNRPLLKGWRLITIPQGPFNSRPLPDRQTNRDPPVRSSKMAR